jgi:hypothetical protein
MKPREPLVMKLVDPLRLETDLPLEGMYYPLGFRLHIRTNSHDVLRAAEESWDGIAPEFECETIEYHVVVEPGEPSGIPEHRAQGHLYSVVSDAQNFAQVDLERMCAGFFLSDRTVADHTSLRWFYIESITYLLLAQHYVVPVHSACVARERGVMLAGPSGAGKSTLSFACARAGWTFVSDDCVFLMKDHHERLAIGRPRQARFRMDAPALFPELERYVARARPNGKISIEAPLKDFPQIRTAARATVGCLVLLERGSNVTAGIQRIDSEEAVARILSGGPSYGARVNEMHERIARQLVDAPAYRLGYERLDDAVRLLDEVG